MKELVLVLCWLGVVQSILLGTYFLSISKKSIDYFFLGGLMWMIGIRVTKSIIFLFEPNPPLFVMNIGFAAHAMLGPLFLFYIQSLKGYNDISRRYYLHFTPAILIAILAFYLKLESFWYRGGYSVLLYYTLIYLLTGWYLLVKNYKKEKPGHTLLFLLGALTIFQLSYFSNYILRLTPYETGAILHSLLIYIISFLVLRSSNFIGAKKRKYQNLNISPEEIERYRQKLTKVMSDQKPYLKSQFNLNKCGELTGIQPHILSFVLSESFQQNFLHFTNSYRVEEAKEQLTSDFKKNLSIAGIAQDCGFNTLSSFNTAFKKFTGMTPSDFRKKNFKNSEISK